MMALIAKESGGGGGDFTPVPQGMHLARCYRVVDLGTQETSYQGKVKNLAKVMLQFEVHGEDESGKPIVTDKGEPMSISKNFTLSLGEMATLRKDLQTWRGREFTPEELRGFELKNVLGAWAMISVIKAMGTNGKEYTNIAAILSVPPAIKKAGLPTPHNELKIFSIDEADTTLFDSFSKSLKEKIEKSPEWQARGGVSAQASARPSAGSFEDMDSDIPF
jgi:hypothetical protein